MRSPFYQAVFETRLSPDRQAVEEFKTTAGGCRRSSSVLGGLTGRGADIIIIDDPIKAGDSQSDARRDTVNAEFYNTIYSRLNNKETGAIVIIMQRLHADDLVAYVQEREAWEVVAFPAIAERDENYDIRTPYGRRRFVRKKGGALQPARESLATLEDIRSRDAYVFAAQYQQDPQPEAGIIVKREWLHRFDLSKPPAFETKIQSWDTANKVTELSDYSVCTTWGVRDQHLYLLDVIRKRMEFPELKRTVRELAALHRAETVLVEDNASGTQLIQQLHAENFSIIQPVSTSGADKVMRLRAQTAKIESGFAQFPEKAPWLDAYLLELTSFPNSKNDDQVDSTVHALAWLTEEANTPGIGLLRYYQQEAAKNQWYDGDGENELVKVRSHVSTMVQTADGRKIYCVPDQIIEVDSLTAGALCQNPRNFERVSE
jgi:predicted phage terminase large subunit-like protein